MTYIDPRGKLLAHLPRLAALQLAEKPPPPPINVEVDLSNRCSLGCEWCHFAYTHTRGPLAGKRGKPDGAIAGGDLMDTALAMRMLDQLADAGAESVTWTGGGEPTLHPDFDLIVDYCAKTGLRQAIYTHGGHIGEERAARLKQQMTFVYVSLDAVNAGSYMAAKGVNRFEQACEGIRLLAAAEGPATVGVGFLVTPDNWADSDEAARLTGRLGADYVQFRPTIQYTQDDPDKVAEDTFWLDSAIPRLTNVAARHPNVVFDFERFRMYRDWKGHGYHTCWWSGLQTVITPNGKVWTCVNKREHPAALLGDLTEESFRALWARRPVAMVDGACRVLCRGHIANTVLDGIMQPREHDAFV